MQLELLFQALLVAIAASAPTPQRPSLPDLSGIIGGGSGLPSIPGLGSGSGSGGLPSLPGLGSGGSDGGLPSLPSFPGLGGGAGGAGGSKLNLTKIRELLDNAQAGGSGSQFDLAKLRELLGNRSDTGSGLPSIPGLGSGGGSGGLPSIPSFPGLGSGGGSGGLPSIPSFPGSGSGGGSGGLPSIPSFPGLGSGGGSGGLPSIPGLGSGGGSGGLPSIPSFGGGSTGGGLSIPSFGGSSTANDVTSKKACKDNILLFARGTTEGGNVGSSVGPALIREIEKAAPGKFLFQGVDYQADIAGITGLGRAGGDIAVRQFGEAAALCPDARIHLSGYSQGAMVMHNAVRSASVDKAKIGGLVMFGDPFQKQAFTGVDASKVKIFCATGDSVCTGGFTITPAHLSYTSSGDTAKGAQFIAGLAA